MSCSYSKPARLAPDNASQIILSSSMTKIDKSSTWVVLACKEQSALVCTAYFELG
jgi:hypothetical protein